MLYFSCYISQIDKRGHILYPCSKCKGDHFVKDSTNCKRGRPKKKIDDSEMIEKTHQKALKNSTKCKGRLREQ